MIIIYFCQFFEVLIFGQNYFSGLKFNFVFCIYFDCVLKFLTTFQFLTKIYIFHQISMFHQHFPLFFPSWFLTKVQFLTKNSIFYENFNFWPIVMAIIIQGQWLIKNGLFWLNPFYNWFRYDLYKTWNDLVQKFFGNFYFELSFVLVNRDSCEIIQKKLFKNDLKIMILNMEGVKNNIFRKQYLENSILNIDLDKCFSPLSNKGVWIWTKK